jgi:alanine-synthesizing transaminase
MSTQDHLSWIDNDPLRTLNAMKLKKIEAGEMLFDLSMINPDIEPPRYLIDRLVEASLKSMNHRYAVSRGIRKLREAFASKYKKCFEVAIEADSEACVVMGTKDALIHTFAAHLRPGDRVLMGAPTYPLYLSSAKLSNLQCSFFPISSDEDAMLASIAVALGDNSIRMLVLNFPNNPTGICVTSYFYQRLSELVQNRDLLVFNDFVYGEMTYNNKPAVSLLSVNDLRPQAVECYSMSKAYSVPGWRVGALLGNRYLVQRFSRLKSHVDYGLPLPIQHAAAAGLTTDQDLVSVALSRYEARARALVAGLRRIGWDVDLPGGGVCVWAKIPDRFSEEGSLAFSERLLAETGILVTPGFLYGTAFDRLVRFALVVNQEKIIEVIDRLEKFVELKKLPHSSTHSNLIVNQDIKQHDIH